jgi:hypothetical protein
MKNDEYDGFYFIPGDEDDALNLAYFRIKEDSSVGVPIEFTEVGNMYHIAFFKNGSDGHPEFDEEFEAIFADPSVYIRNLIGMKIYGCVLKKTEYSREWWQEYLEKAKEYCRLLKIKHVVRSLTELKDAKSS